MGRPDRPGIVYLDACCYIDWATGKFSASIVEGWIAAARRGQVRICASTLLLAEARGGSKSDPNPAAEQKIRKLLHEPYVMLVDVSRRVALTARDLIVDNPRIKGWDSIHLATAVVAKADVLLTRNTNDFAADSKVRGVWIDQPYEFGGEALFSLRN